MERGTAEPSANMEPATTEKDPFSFDIQLNTEDDKREFRRKNDGDEIQRPDVVDDICRGLLLQARIDRIVHGYETEKGSPATLVVFGFRFHGIDTNRRFKQAKINILFRDEKKRPKTDPEVVALWPNGDFALGEPTQIDVDVAKGGDVGANITGGTVVQGDVSTSRKWERKQKFSTTDRSRLTGSIVLDTSVRMSGPNNAVFLTVSEDATATSGLVTDLRAAVLLKRKNEDDIFLATVTVEAKANFMYNAIRGIRDISGHRPANDPVRFKPGQQYLRKATLGAFLEAKLAAEVDENNLNAASLDELAGALGATVLTGTV